MKSLRCLWSVGLLSVLWWLSAAFIAPPSVLAADPSVTTGRWATFDNNTPNYPGDADVVRMVVDGSQRLWVGTEGDGIAMFDGFTWTTFNNSNTGGKLLSDTVFFMKAFSNEIWIGGPNGISVFISNKNEWHKFTTDEGLPTNLINGLAAGEASGSDFGRFYFATADMGVVICNIDRFQKTLTNCPEVENQANGKLHSDNVFDIFGTTEHRWMLTGAGAVQVDHPFFTPDPEQRHFYDYGTPGCPNIAFANRMTPDGLHNRVWFTLGSRVFAAGDPGPGYGACIFDINSSTWRLLDTSNSGLEDDSVVDVAVDREGRAWFGAVGDKPGVSVYTPVSDACCWQIYHTDTPGVQMAENNVRTVTASLDRVWFGHFNSLSSFALHWQAFPHTVQALASLPGQLLVGDFTGLYTFNGTTFTPLRPNVDVQNIFAPSANEIWLATTSGLHHWNGSAWEQFTTSNSGLASNSVSSVAQDNLGRIWAGTLAGASVFDRSSNSWATFDTSNVLLANNVRDIAIKATGHVWLATTGGVSRFDGSNWTNFTTVQGLPSNEVHAIDIDSEGHIWAGTLKGPAVYLDNGFDTTFTTISGLLPTNNVLTIHAPPTGGVWLGVPGAAFYFPYVSNFFERYRAANSGLSHELLRAITSDASGALWFGGINYAPGNVPGGLFVRSVDLEPLGNSTPTITDVTPLSGVAGVTVTITGSEFQPGSKVFFGANGPGSGVLAETLSLSGTMIEVRLPSQAVKGKVRVTNSVGGATSANEFSPIPVITAIDPRSGPIGLPIKIIGTNLASTGFSEVKFGGSAYSSLIISTTRHNLIEAVVPADASNGTLKVKTTGGEAIGPDFTLTSGGLKLLDWEVHQGLPQYQHLVAGKSTVVRLFLGADVPGGCAYVTGVLLQILGPGGFHVNYAQTLTNNGIPNGGWFCGMTKQVATGGSIDFVVPGDSLPKGKINLAVSFSSRFVTLFDKVLGDYIFTPTDDLRVHIAAPGWEFWDDPNVYGPMTASEVGSSSINRQLVNFPRIYPVRDGAGGIFSENGLRWILNPNFVFCNGVDDGFCDHAGTAYNFLYDFWQEDISGVPRFCMVQSRFPSNAIDDDSVMRFKVSFNPHDLKRMDFIVMVRPGVALPADLNTLVTFDTGSPDLVVESREIIHSFQGPAGCPSLTYTDMFMFRTRVRNTGENTFANQIIQADYNEGVVNAAANGGIVLGNGAVPQTYIQRGQFFMIDGAQGDMFDPPMDMSHNGAIESDDLALFVSEFDDWNPSTGEYVTTHDFGLVTPKDVLRNFIDKNHNQAADPSDTWAPSLERHRDQYIRYAIYDVPRNYRDAFNEHSPVDAQFSQLWLWDRVNPQRLMGLAGQAPGNDTMWAMMDSSTAIVHETGHNVGLQHSAEPGIPNVPYGYNVVEHRVVLGPKLQSAIAPFAGGPVEDAFFQPLQYEHVYNVFRNQFGQTASAAMVSAVPAIHITGMIHRDGQVEVSDSYLSSQLSPTPIDVAGDYWLRLVGIDKGKDKVLADYRFGVDFDVAELPEGEPQPDQATFEVTQPWVDGTKFIEIWESGHRLYQLPVSASAPTVTLQSPNGGENVAANGDLTVQWSGSDADGDPLAYTVYYSPDGGTLWLTLAAATKATKIVVPAAQLPGSANALVEVRASDGVNVATDRSNAAFQVAGKGPQWATIVAPTAGEQLVQSQLQTLVGSAYDLEDGNLPGSQLSWRSDQLGMLGTGETFSVTLPVGVHQLTLVARDSANLTVATSITVEVLADFDGDGLADAYEKQYGELAWWNPDDAGTDPDGDGLTSRSEAAWGSDPGKSDSDGDGTNDGDEAAAGSLPNDPNSKPQAARVMASETKLSYAMATGGANPASTLLLLMNSTPSEIAWTASVNGAWLKLNTSSGKTPAEVTVSINGAGLKAGIYQGKITFQGGAAPWEIPVTLTVADQTPPDQTSSMHLRLPALFR